MDSEGRNNIKLIIEELFQILTQLNDRGEMKNPFIQVFITYKRF
jgi:hypothetical protein